MSIERTSPKPFLGAQIPNVKVLSSKIDEIINKVNEISTDADALLANEGVTGNSQLAAFYPSVAQNDIAAGTGGAISITTYLTTINTDAGGDNFTLANALQPGQIKKILLVVDGGGNGVVTPVSLTGGTTITFQDAADYVILQWTGTSWVCLENSGCAIA